MSITKNQKSLCNSTGYPYCGTMAYVIEKGEDGSVRITYRLNPEGEKLTFVEAVGACLSRRVLLITVDIGDNPGEIQSIVDPLVRLHGVLKARGHAVNLSGSGLKNDSSIWQKLHREGVKFVDDGGKSGFDVEAVISQDDSLPLPGVSLVRPHFEKVQREHRELTREREYLKEEESLYRSRLALIKRFVGDVNANKILEPVKQEEAKVQVQREALDAVLNELKGVELQFEERSRAYHHYIDTVRQDEKLKIQSFEEKIKKVEEEAKKAGVTLSKPGEGAPKS